jgi:hypothetical protein
MRLVRLVVVLCLSACAAKAAEPRPLVVPSPRVVAPPAPVAEAEDPYAARLGEVKQAIRTGDLARAEALLAPLRTLVAGQHPRLEVVVFYEAALRAYRGDLAGTAKILPKILLEHLANGGVPAGSWAHLGYHNALIMVRTAQGDLVGALGECAAMVEAGQLPPWTDDDDGRQVVLLKKYWHEAYLLRMVAVAIDPWHRGPVRRAAEYARAAYRALATSGGTNADSIAVLDGFFAVHAGDAPAALAAARLVDVALDDDVEDLYLVQLALDASGYADAALAVRARIASLDDPSIAVPIMAMWLRRDDAPAPHRFSPRHPDAPPE